MNKFALLPIFLLLFFSMKAQDRIIKIDHDTIHCRIVSIDKEHIMIEVKNRDGSVTGKTLRLSQVAEYSSFPQLKNKSKTSRLKVSKPEKVPVNVWSLSLSVGGSNMPWYFDKLETAAMPDYYNQLETGFHINTSAHYMVDSFWGVGAEHSFFNSNISGSIPTQYSSSLFLMVSEKYRHYINYLGPSLLFMQYVGTQRKFILSETLSVGAMFVRLEGQSTYPNVDNSGYHNATTNSLLTGNSLSAKFGLSAEYRLNRNVSVGLGGNYIWGSLKKAYFESKGPSEYTTTSQNQNLPNPLNLSRIDYSVILRYQF
jgi:hypothetical protein